MLTKTKSKPKNNYLRLITPRISFSIIEISLEEAKGFLTLGISNKKLNKFKQLANDNQFRSAPIFNIELMKLYINDIEVYRWGEILQRAYDEALKQHSEYIGESLNKDWYSQIDYFDKNLDNFSFSIAFDRYYEQSQQLCVFDDNFDFNKISCGIRELYLEEGKEYLNCHWYHGLKHFQTISEGKLVKEDIYLLTNSSRRFDLKFF
jgi:hypothetical protein